MLKEGIHLGFYKLASLPSSRSKSQTSQSVSFHTWHRKQLVVSYVVCLVSRPSQQAREREREREGGRGIHTSFLQVHQCVQWKANQDEANSLILLVRDDNLES